MNACQHVHLHVSLWYLLCSGVQCWAYNLRMDGSESSNFAYWFPVAGIQSCCCFKIKCSQVRVTKLRHKMFYNRCMAQFPFPDYLQTW